MSVPDTTYEAQFNKAKKDGQVQDRSYSIHKWSKPGEVILGRLVAVADFAASKFDTTVRQYFIQTDNRLVSTVCGASVDPILTEEYIGDIVRIEYKGKAALDSGRSMNQFDVKIVKAS